MSKFRAGSSRSWVMSGRRAVEMLEKSGELTPTEANAIRNALFKEAPIPRQFYPAAEKVWLMQIRPQSLTRH